MAEVSKDWRMTPRQNREKPKTKPKSLREMERAERDARRKTERGNVSTQRRLTTTPVSEEPAEESPMPWRRLLRRGEMMSPSLRKER